MSVAAHESIDFHALRAVLPGGRVTTPADADWASARAGWAVNVPQQPAAVIRVADADQVAGVVRFARTQALSVSAQPVGHSATTDLNGALLLRTAEMSELSVDAERRIARVGAGVRWQALLTAAGKHGLVPLSGSSGDPSVVGLCVGGGLSWFARRFGTSADSIVAIELVDADGQVRRVTRHSDPELFWALRGGGGDFGIVTAVQLRLFPAPQVYGGRLLWPIEAAPDVLRAYLRITAGAPDELTAWAHLLRFPPLPHIPEPLRGGAFVSVEIAHLGPAEHAQALLAPLRALPAPMMDTMGVVEIADLPAITAEPIDPMPDMHIGELITDLDDAATAALLSVAGPQAQTSLMIVQLRHLGGALAHGDPTGGATGVIDEEYALMALGVPVDAGSADAIATDLRLLRGALSTHLSGRAPFTFLAADDPAARAFTPDALARLREIKRRRDPLGVIRSNHPVLATD